MNLNELAKKYRTDKKIPDGNKCQNGLFGHGYTVHYEKILNKRNIKTMLEIGVSFGGSIKMWDEYFNKKCHITGIDIEEKRFKKKDVEASNIRIKIGSQNDVNFLKTLCDIKYDLIIDDGSHKSDDQLISFNELFDNLNSGGIYIIEDLHVAKKTEHVFESFGTNDDFYKLHLKSDLINKIKSVEFYESNKLCVIYKK
jgi:hypothetical protein